MKCVKCGDEEAKTNHLSVFGEEWRWLCPSCKIEEIFRIRERYHKMFVAKKGRLKLEKCV